MAIGANEDDGDSWRAEMGRLWLENLDHQERMLAPIGEQLLAAMALSPGERVADIGAGGGWLSRRMAEVVGPQGEVVAVEISPPLLAEGARRSAHLPQLRWFSGDAGQNTPPGAPFDRLVSRFGVMFFAEPLPAFRHLRTLLKPGGRLHLVVWDRPKRNPWMVEMQKVAKQYLDLPKPEPLAPGPFQLAEPGYLDSLLRDTGFVAVGRRRLPVSMQVGGVGATPAEAARRVTESMMLGHRLADQPEEVRRAIRYDLELLYARHRTAEGVAMPGSIWLVQARAG